LEIHEKLQDTFLELLENHKTDQERLDARAKCEQNEMTIIELSDKLEKLTTAFLQVEDFQNEEEEEEEEEEDEFYEPPPPIPVLIFFFSDLFYFHFYISFFFFF